MRSLLLTLLCAVCLCACDRPSSSTKLYNPSQEPLSADELAALLNVFHWKITQTPNDGKPYWGVRIVVANHGSTYLPVSPPPPPYHLLRTAAILSFDSPVASDGNPQILLGMKIENGNISGKMTVTSPDTSTHSTQFQIERSSIPMSDSSQMNSCSGTVWAENRVDLIDYRDTTNLRPTAAICLEFLHSAPQ